MKPVDLEKFHEISQNMNFSGVIENLLLEFQQGRIADRKMILEEDIINSAFSGIFSSWNMVFPAFPECRLRRRTVLRELKKGHRDAYLRDIIISCAQQSDNLNGLIVNTAAVYGGNARLLARVLPRFEILATDIDPRPNTVFCFFSKIPKNYRFLPEDIYKPNLDRQPFIVVFFGACGSLTDASMQYAIDVN